MVITTLTDDIHHAALLVSGAAETLLSFLREFSLVRFICGRGEWAKKVVRAFSPPSRLEHTRLEIELRVLGSPGVQDHEFGNAVVAAHLFFSCGGFQRETLL